MTEVARHHHYVPQGYLRGFAQQKGRRSWYSHVIDFVAQEAFLSNVRNLCGERDFMRVDLDGYAPDVIEKALAPFEAQCTQAIRNLAKYGQTTAGEFNKILNLMALLVVRSPARREQNRQLHDQIARRVMDTLLENKPRWEQQVARMQADGVDASGVAYEELKAFHDSGEYDVHINREYHIALEFEVMDAVLDELARRRWTVFITTPEIGEFLTTDSPVILNYINPEEVPPFYRQSPGFGLPNTEVFFPLTRQALLLGRFDLGGRTTIASKEWVAAVNTHIACYANRRVFSSKSAVLYLDPRTCTVRHDQHFLDRIQQVRSGQQNQTEAHKP